MVLNLGDPFIPMFVYDSVFAHIIQSMTRSGCFLICFTKRCWRFNGCSSCAILSNKQAILAKYNLKDKNYLLFFLGSRPAHFAAFSLLCLDSINYLLDAHPDLHVIFSIPSSIPEDLVLTFTQQASKLDRVFILKGESLDFMAISKLMVSLPGTNTAEAMYMKCPMITVAPLNKPELISLDGLLGLFVKIPFLGKLLMAVIIRYLKRKIRFVSLPNKIHNKPIVPEFIKVFTPELFQCINSCNYMKIN